MFGSRNILHVAYIIAFVNSFGVLFMCFLYLHKNCFNCMLIMNIQWKQIIIYTYIIVYILTCHQHVTNMSVTCHFLTSIKMLLHVSESCCIFFDPPTSTNIPPTYHLDAANMSLISNQHLTNISPTCHQHVSDISLSWYLLWALYYNAIVSVFNIYNSNKNEAPATEKAGSPRNATKYKKNNLN